MISFTVNSKIRGKARPRFTRSGHVYTPRQTAEYEKQIRKQYIKASRGAQPLECAVKINITAYFLKPKSAKRELPTIKPDLDNIIKAVLDALNKIAYTDDKNVVDISAKKMYDSNIEHLEITVEEADGETIYFKGEE